MYEYTKPIIEKAEALAKGGASLNDVLTALRELCLDDLGELLMHMPDTALPSLSAILPAMASAEVQNNWTGTNGYQLLGQTINFTRSVAYQYQAVTGRTLDSAKIMDFGCGYGRIARLMYRYTDPERVFCVDPLDASLDICRDTRIPSPLFKSDFLLRDLPFADKDFDLIYAFSVFTHLSEKTTRLALETLHRHIAPNGVLVITIRPEEYWQFTPEKVSDDKRAEMIASHRAKGFAFSPHNRELIEGEVTYGDTSITLDWLAREFPQWKLKSYDRSLADPYQILLFLQPA